MKPLVSILMTSYNRKRYIAVAIESVLASTYRNIELIVVDDGSKDETVEIARRFEELNDKVKVFVNERNLGDYPNRNKAASYARGKYIMYVDSDDQVTENGIELCVKSMLSHPDAKFGMYDPAGAKEAYILQSSYALRKHLFKKPFLTIGPGGTIIERAFFNEINGYPEKYGPANDMYFNLKACSKTNILMLPFEFCIYRRHDGQEINNRYGYLHNNYLYMRDAVNELKLPASKKELNWLRNKNNRRFAVNMSKFFLKERSISEIKFLLNKTQFGLEEFFKGIFH